MHSKILELLEKLNQTVQSSVNSSFSRIEIDIIQQQLRNLYEELDALKRIPKIVEQTYTVLEPNLLHNKMILPINKVEEIKEIIKAEKPLLVEIKPLYKPVTVELKPIEKAIVSPIVVNTKPVEKILEPLLNTEVTKPTRLEPAAPSTTTINMVNNLEKLATVESLNQRLKPATTEVHKKLAIKPLKELIDLNKRFVLVNELFKGDSSLFADTIQQIDGYSDYISANAFIISQNFDWEENSQAYRLFRKLVKQKFGEE